MPASDSEGPPSRMTENRHPNRALSQSPEEHGPRQPSTTPAAAAAASAEAAAAAAAAAAEKAEAAQRKDDSDAPPHKRGWVNKAVDVLKVVCVCVCVGDCVRACVCKGVCAGVRVCEYVSVQLREGKRGREGGRVSEIDR